MKQIKLLIILLLLPLFLHAQTKKDNIKSIIGMFEEGLKNKDTKLIHKTFSENISISTGMGTDVNGYLEPLLKNLNFESVELLSDTLHSEKETVYTNVKFVTKQYGAKESIVAFDNENKILFIDYFDRLFGSSRYRESSLVATIPFSREDSFIVLSLKLNDNDRPLLFMLDTGADGMAIRKSLADSIGIKPGFTKNTNIVGGSTQVNISTGNTVHLTDSLSLAQQNIAIFDQIHDNLDGIIGLNLIKRYITKIDFDNKKICLYSLGNLQYNDNGTTIPIKMPQNVIQISSVLNLTDYESVTANFLFDMGANYKLIVFSDFVHRNRLLQSGFKPESIGTTVSMGHSTPVYNGKAHELRIGDIVSNNIPITLQSAGLDNSSQNNGIDGSIGVQFWSEYNLTIDLLKKEIHLTPRETGN